MNEKLKQAYELLDLPENITREDLEKRFDLLLKRQRSSSAVGKVTSNEEEFRAFKFILDTWDQQEIKEEEDRRLAKWGRLASPARTIENFFRLYKMHTIISIIVLIVLVFGGNSLYKYMQEREYQASLPPIDAKIVFLGNYESQDPEGENDELNKAILTQYPAWKRVETSIIYLPTTGSGTTTLDMTYLQRAVAVLASETPDILIMDEAALLWVGQQEGLQDLDLVVSARKIPQDDTRLKRVEEGHSQHEVVGIDITDTQFAASLPINFLGMIAGVLAGEDTKEKALDFIEHIMESDQP
ncbi:hypothetical protein J2T13_002948 [Paenibacillus sp. DS2015]|uniref:hypothetical protein n=1 Tax=Paenibacillus sp. DS2015 TaxID=3373917 RepID=UPI003D1AB1AF